MESLSEPQLLDQIDLADTINTIDAIGRQKDIVEKIVKGGGDCVIAVEGKQPKLSAAIQGFFSDHLERDMEDLRYRCHETRDEGHRRIDERSYFLAKVPRDFATLKERPWIKAIGYTARITQHPDGRETDEVRDDLSSRDLSGKRSGEAVRNHWSIESMHWVLDVNFREDEHRTRGRRLGNNLSGPRRFAVTLLKPHHDKDSLRGNMMSCRMNTDNLAQDLKLQQLSDAQAQTEGLLSYAMRDQEVIPGLFLTREPLGRI
ncbi:ISAs1 family transposase [Singulisphaera rosea]